MRDNVGVPRRRSRAAPAVRRNESLLVRSAISAHPRRPGMAERVKRHPGEPMLGDDLRLPALRPLDGRQAAGGDLGIEEQEIPMSALAKSEHAPSGLYR